MSRYLLVTWLLAGEATVDHIAILAKGSSGWTEVSDLPAKSGSIRILDLHLEAEATGLCVEAAGKASMQSLFRSCQLSAR